MAVAGACSLLFASLAISARQDQDPPVAIDPLHARLDRILDTYVRDGLVYYRALKAERRVLDNYVAALGAPETAAAIGGWSGAAQQAFWVNAYNAFVLQTVIDAYPIQGSAADYPANSIGQIPGVFEVRTHRAAGRTVTLHEIERTVLPAFGDPRLYLALGRGAVGGGRLRSEAYASARLDQQLGAMAAECLTRRHCVQIDHAARIVRVTPVFGWHEAEFARAYGSGARFASRSPIERAIFSFLEPHLLPTEARSIADGRYAVRYLAFDWRLNDLTGGRSDVEH
jgi:hypothetical protein